MKTINTIPTNDLCTLTHNMDCALHKHLNCEFTLLLMGKAKTTVDSVSCTLDTGNIIFINNHSTHALETIITPYQHRDIYLSHERLKNICETHFDDCFFNYLMQPNTIFKIPVDMHEFKNIATRLQKLQAYYTLYPENNRQDIIKSCILSIIVYLLGILYENYCLQDSNSSNSLSWIFDFIAHIQKPEIFTRPIQEIIEESNYSHSHFCYSFKKAYNRTFKSYINELRINHAMSLLKNTALSVLDIAVTCGYSNPSHFSQLFKNQTGFSPLEYRHS